MLTILAAASLNHLYPPVAPFTRKMLPTVVVRVPMIFPLVGKCSWEDNYNANYGSHRHTGQDIRAPKMTPIVASFSGRIGLKQFSFWIEGDNGWRILATHLNDDSPGTNDGGGGRDYMFAPNVHHGDYVKAGQLIGYVGNSGDATGPHLHFELHGPNGIRNPLTSLKYAQKLKAPRPRLPDSVMHPRPGHEVWIIAPRGDDGSFLNGVVIARIKPGGAVSVDDAPHFATIKLLQNDADVLNQGVYVGIEIRREGSTILGTKSEIYRLREGDPDGDIRPNWHG